MRRRRSFARDFPQYDRERFLKVDDEAPVHQVRITHDFYLGQTEVTVGSFAGSSRRQAMSSSRSVTVPVATASIAITIRRRRCVATQFGGRNPNTLGATPVSRRPMPIRSSMSPGAMRWRWPIGCPKNEGVRYRLPTEAEWEYACRAGTHTRYASGDDPRSLIVMANVFDKDTAVNWPKWDVYALPLHDGFAFTAPSRFAPNAFGLYDMHGNAWEWTADWHADDYYAHSPVDDPQGPETGDVRVRRGGSWHTWPFYARSTFRSWNTPTTRYTLVGFRLDSRSRKFAMSEVAQPARMILVSALSGRAARPLQRSSCFTNIPPCGAGPRKGVCCRSVRKLLAGCRRRARQLKWPTAKGVSSWTARHALSTARVRT